MGPIKKFNRGKLRNYFGNCIIVLKPIQKFDSRVKFFLIVVSFQAASASCFYSNETPIGVKIILINETIVKGVNSK